MSSHLVDKLVMELELELRKFKGQAQEAEKITGKLKGALDEAESSSKGASKGVKETGDNLAKAGGQAGKATSSLFAMARGLRGIFVAVMGSTALERLATHVAKVNDNLNFMQQRLNMSAASVTKFSNAAAMLGGDAAGMQQAMRGLNQSIQQLVIMGDSSALPFFNALGVGVTDAQGKVRDMDAIMLDMADAFGVMDKRQAYALASAMGLDDGVANALLQGRAAMQEMIDMQSTLYTSTQQELMASRELRKNQALLGAQWDSLKMMLGNALVPMLAKMTEWVKSFTEYLLKNERNVKNVFEGFAYVVGVVATLAIGKAVAAALALLAPFGLMAAAVAAAGAAFIALYDDYKVWARGGESLFDWTKFDKYIKNATMSADTLSRAFSRLLTGYNDWESAVAGFKSWLELKGFTDSLSQGFKNVARDIFNAIPPMRDFAEIVSKLLSGDFKGALETAGRAVAEGTIRAATWSVEHVAGALDVAMGQDPADDHTLSAAVRASRSTALGFIGAGESGGGGGAGFSSLSGSEKEALIKTAVSLGIAPNDLAAIISFETGGTFSPNARNPKSSATGLIQFMAGTGGEKGKYYGMTRDELGSLSFIEQLKLVERYYRERGFSESRKRTTAEAYSAVTGWGYRKGSKEYDLNKVWDSNKDGYISQHEVADNPEFRAHQRYYLGDGRQFARGASTVTLDRAGGSGGSSVEVRVDNVNVHTTAPTLPEATADAIKAAVQRVPDLDQVAGGLQ